MLQVPIKFQGKVHISEKQQEIATPASYKRKL